MSGSARMILAVEPAEKGRWEGEAQKAGISTAEYLRRAAAAYDPDFDPAEIEQARALIAEMSASAARMTAMLDDTLARLDSMDDPEREAQTRARIMAELEANPPTLDFSIFASRIPAAA